MTASSRLAVLLSGWWVAFCVLAFGVSTWIGCTDVQGDAPGGEPVECGDLENEERCG